MNFDEFITVSDWTQALQQLISLANNAVQQNDQNELGTIQDLLIQFQNQSPPSMNSLDVIAFKTVNALNKTQRQAVLTSLNELSLELINLTKLINKATDQATQSTDEIQLKNTKEFLTKAKVSLGILTGLRADMQDTTTDLGKKVEAVFKAIGDFQQAFSG